MIIFADRDEPGLGHALKMAGSLLDVAAEASIVEPARGKDGTEWYESGGQDEMISELLKAAFGVKSRLAAEGLADLAQTWGVPMPSVSRSGESQPVAVSKALSEIESKELRWLWRGRIAYGKLTFLDGDPGAARA